MDLKKIFSVALGIVTSIGGFLDIGSIATSSQAGAQFGFALIWALVLGTVCVIFLVEMAGRLAAVSHHTLGDALRERFGPRFFLVIYGAEALVEFALLAAEIGGVCIALQLVTGVSYRWWALPVAVVLWFVLWRGTFGLIENGIASLGLITLVFVAGVVVLHPDWGAVLGGLVPTLPRQDTAHYLFTAVSILGASISPYLLYFYSSGGVEDHWDESQLGANRATAVLGMGFGSTVALAVLVVAALTLHPQGVPVDSYDQAAQMLVPAFGAWGVPLFAAALAIACTGATLEISLNTAYLTAQGFGWNWSASARPKDAARFSLFFTVDLFLASLLLVAGVDPLQLTLFTMALIATILPLVIGPFLLLMNDSRYLGRHRNGPIGNLVVIFIIGLAFVLAVVSIPLEIVGGG